MRWARHSRLDIDILSMPARFWKWRMDGAAVTLARRWPEMGVVDAIVATDMLDLATFLGLSRRATARIPTALYMHENQLTYPLPPAPESGPGKRQHGERSRHYAFVNATSMVAADQVVFNSEFHRRDLASALGPFLQRFPDFPERAAFEAAITTSTVLPVGVETSDLPVPVAQPAPSGPPLVVWNQRWEYDKNQGELLGVLVDLAGDGIDFRVALCGEQFGHSPEEIARGVADLGARIVHTGFLPRPDYARLLGEGTVVVSTAHHEFFGVAVLEAACAGAMPLLPRRLAYPELLPQEWHSECLYETREDLRTRLRAALEHPRASKRLGAELGHQLRAAYDWAGVAPRYDAMIERLVRADC